MNVVITVILLIVMLGILIGMHELGHLAVAKAFNVYCLEYSIGFGPKLFSHTRKGGETVFSIRGIPLGGYVSMYGEGVVLPEGKEVPKERSLEGITHPRKALIMVAGVGVNFFLAVLFTMIYAIAFPSYYTASYVDTGLTESLVYVDSSDTESLTAKGLCFWASGNIGGTEIDSSANKLFSPDVMVDLKNNQKGYLLDDSTTINGETYCTVFLYKSIVEDNNLLSCVSFYSPLGGYFANAYQQELGISNYPDFDNQYTVKSGDEITMNLTFLTTSSYDTAPTREEFQSSKNNKKQISITATSDSSGNISLSSSDKVNVIAYQYWAPFGDRLLNGCYYFKQFFVSIGEGLKSIFTLNFNNIGSVVAMGSVLNTSSSEIGWGRTFFLYGGFLSLNLAILNLLPFPGLDGWQLLVTAFEGIFRRKMNEKVKGIVSFVGVGLLLVFGVAIIVKDIVSLVV